jgi:hypothetical protein
LLRYFRINDPYRLVGLLVLLLIFYIPLLIDMPALTYPELKTMVIGEKLNEDKSMYTGLVDNSAPLAAWFSEAIDSLFGRSLLARHILAFILLFLQAAYVGIMFILRKAFNENTYIPALLFCLLSFVSYDTLAFSGELIGLTFMLFALNSLFKEIEFRVQRDETIFNLGLFISLASLCSFAFCVYLFCVMIILFFFTRTTIRKFLLLIFGFLLPHLMVISIAYLSGSLSKMWPYFYVANLGFSREVFISTKSLMVLGALPALYFVISVFMLQREARFSKYQSQLLQVMFLWIGFSVVYVLYCKDLRPQSMIVFVPGLAFLFTHFFLFIRRRRYAEINIWILLVGIVSISYLARYNKLESVDYRLLTVSDEAAGASLNHKRVLALENNLLLFRNNTLATPYLNWSLSESIFRNPEYYENITEVYHMFKADPPQVIVDKENLMKPFLERMPEIKKQYLRMGEVYNQVSSN